MKCLFRAAGIPVAPGVRLTAGQFYADTAAALDAVEQPLGWPVIIKPVNLGSSVGIAKARDRAELERGIEQALQFTPVVLCEQAIPHLREINCAVLGDRDGARVSVCEEPLNATDFLTYADKYQSGGGKGGKTPAGGKTAGAGMQSLSRKVPADLPPELTQQAQELARRAFLAIDAAGMSRVDLLLDDETKTLYVNEINTIRAAWPFTCGRPAASPSPPWLDEMVAIASSAAASRAPQPHFFHQHPRRRVAGEQKQIAKPPRGAAFLLHVAFWGVKGRPLARTAAETAGESEQAGHAHDVADQHAEIVADGIAPQPDQDAGDDQFGPPEADRHGSDGRRAARRWPCWRRPRLPSRT